MIPTLRDAAQQALEALEWADNAMYEGTPIQVNTQKAIAALRAALAEPQEPVEATPYNLRRIAWELERTAVGDGFYGNALRVAKDMPGITPEDRSVLDRYATGTQTGTDHVHLQWLAQRLYNKDERAPEAPQPAIQPGWATAYAAFKGAFDTPLARRRDSGEYAQDARRLLREFNDAMLAAPEAPQPAKQPLLADEICDSWEFTTGHHQIQFGPNSEGRYMYWSPDEVIEFARALERAHGIGEQE